MPSVPYWKLRRLAPRTERVQGRWSAKNAMIKAYDHTIPVYAAAFMKAFDAARKYEAAWRKEMGEGKSAVAALLGKVLGWKQLAARDVAGFDARDFGDNPDIPDDVISDADRLLDHFNDLAEGAGDEPGLAYVSDAVQELGDTLTAAQKEWQEAEEADATYQQLLAAVRTSGGEFDDELQRFRRTLAMAAGRSSKDFQKLRSARATHADEDDDADAPPVPPPVEPAPPE